ncbi:FxLYD domain-containing protein [Oceanobacillus alkalisoli]|uniref:FxLYD domain-containing protein n=1 Tax=Oceanobacillus alkalisoli TaxID=2925113 RepID=UPI001EE4B63F|nr:FxLYD domain-containing protein [Oceanobacillus alkalisoli]MCG5105384.1 FxLYD domain-containing protein [Oceanobacillus alkalisoli]
MKKLFLLLVVSVLLLSACSNEAKIEQLSKEVDGLAAQGKYLEAAEVQKEINALRRGEKYIKDENPKKTAEIGCKSNFEKLEITNTSINWSRHSDVGDLTGEITNNGSKTLDGYFSVYFFDEDNRIVKDYMTHIPDGGISPGETKYFSIPINKFDFSYYEF